MADPDDDVREIRRVHRQWWAANVGLDVEKMSECFAPDYLMWNLNGHPYYSLAEKEPALKRLALVVRGADTDQRDLTPESRGLVAIAQGFSLAFDDDHEQLAAELPVYDALYAWCRQQAGSARWA